MSLFGFAAFAFLFCITGVLPSAFSLILWLICVVWLTFKTITYQSTRASTLPPPIPNLNVDVNVNQTDMEPWDRLTEFERLFPCSSSRISDLVESHRRVSEIATGGELNLYTVSRNLFIGSLQDLLDDKRASSSPISASLSSLFSSACSGNIRGCFALTERKAGVLSGLIVATTLTLTETETENDNNDNHNNSQKNNNKKKKYVLHTPDRDAEKVWISTAADSKVTHAIVIARFVNNIKNHNDNKNSNNNNNNGKNKKSSSGRPVAVLCRIRDDSGSPVAGVVVDGSEYDDRVIFGENKFGTLTFNEYEVEEDMLLSSCDVEEEEEEQSSSKSSKSSKRSKRNKSSSKDVFNRICRRLFVGRVAFTSVALHLAHRSLRRLLHRDVIKDKLRFRWVSEQVHHFNRMHQNMQEKLNHVVRELDVVFEKGESVSEELNMKIAYLKAGIMFTVLDAVHSFRILAGAKQISSSLGLISVQNMAYMGFLAEGDAVIMCQSYMKYLLQRPFSVIERIRSDEPTRTLHSAYLSARLCVLTARLAVARDKIECWTENQDEIVQLFRSVFQFQMTK